QRDHKKLVTYTAIIVPIYYAVFGVVRFFHHFFVKYIGEQIISDIRIKLMDKFMEMDVLYLSRQETVS
ncbi:MAG: hypothetical protein HRT44_02985, partial [Bdellovibrionales bacterium]|nr:hypothetical protein [Bdellovibrionales bacterium]